MSGGEDGIDWNTDDDLEVASYHVSSSSKLSLRSGGPSVGFAEASCSTWPASSSNSMANDFRMMGFPENLIAKAIEENGEANADTILNTLLTYQAIENSPEGQEPIDPDLPEKQETVDSDHWSSDNGSLLDEASDIDGSSEDEDYCPETTNIQKIKEEITDGSSETDNRLVLLMDMRYTREEASIAIQRCGADSSIPELVDFIYAAQMSKAADYDLIDDPEVKPTPYLGTKRKKFLNDLLKRKKPRGLEKKIPNEDQETLRLPNPMIGFGIPGELCLDRNLPIPDAAIGPPFFYYENVALASKGAWNTISRHLYEIEPEFVDSKHFCAAARKRGYIHNLPVVDRFPLVPLPPRTIHDAMPLTRKWWPSWDKRTKLNCLQTCTASATTTDRIRKSLEVWDDDPPHHIQKYVLDECRKWNLVWVGKHKVAPLEPDEIEMLLGFPKNHTRGMSRTNRVKSLGNSFQIDTVAYHLSVLKDRFPGGINLLSLFSGIGGAEVALHRLGIPLKNVVSVEISESSRETVRSWWTSTEQKGNLIHIEDVQTLNGDRLDEMMSSFGGFDLVVGGSPCNNLAGSNRHSRDGLEGEHSVLFFDYVRILNHVMSSNRR